VEQLPSTFQVFCKVTRKEQKLTPQTGSREQHAPGSGSNLKKKKKKKSNLFLFLLLLPSPRHGFSLCSPGTLLVDKDGLELRDPLTSAFLSARIKAVYHRNRQKSNLWKWLKLSDVGDA
jgi:hypothetical protein